MIITIDRIEYEIPDDITMSSLQLRALAGVTPMGTKDLWEKIPGRCDGRVDSDKVFTMPKNTRRQFFTAPKTINNGKCDICKETDD